MNTTSTAQRLLDLAQKMVQTRGYNGFSFRDLAHEIGIKSASIHYHFPTKADLIAAVALRYREQFSMRLEEIAAQEGSAAKALHLYVELFKETLVVQKRACLCAMLALEVSSLPDGIRAEAVLFFAEQEEWLGKQIQRGVLTGEFLANLEPGLTAKMLLATLEGGIIVARSTGRLDDLENVGNQVLALISTR